MSVKVESKKKKTLLLPPSFEAVTDLPAALQSSRLTRSVSGSPGRKSCILGGGSRVSEAEKSQQPVRVLDDGGNDVTPRPLYQVEPGAPQAKSSRFFLDEASAATASDLTTTTGSFTAPFPRSFFGSSRISSQSTADSVNEETEDTASKRDVSILPPASHVRGGGGVQEAVTEAVTEAMLQQLVDVCVSETDAVPLLDLHSVSVSEEDRDAEAVRQRNDRHAEVCRKRARVEAYTERSTQTLHQETKNKQVQSGAAATVDAATTASSWDIHDSLLISEQDRSPETETVAGPPDTVDGGGRVARSTSAASSASTGSASGPLRDVEALVLKVDVQLVTLSDRLQHSLAVMERCIMGNVFQPKLAAYRQLPVKTGEPDADRKQREECPAVDRLWTFSCELTRGRNVSSMSCNKKNPDLLAVGYGEFDSGNQKPGLICCWSLKNPTWPERLFHCDGGVTAVDFSEKNPNQLAVGTQDGNVAVYDVQTRNETRVIHSRASPNKHLHPVRQVRWSKQERSLAPEKDETLVSASADGRVSKWFLCNNSLDCIDLMKMRRTRHAQKVKKDEKTENVLSAQIGALCLDFHPMDSGWYLVGTCEGFIHKCSSSNNQQVLETYRKHYYQVNAVAWSPFSPDLFLSCSSDWTIQLWHQNRFTPLLSFSSVKQPVYDVRWSPKQPAVFGAVNEDQLEIWDLNSSIVDPAATFPAAPGVRMTSLLFGTETDCVIVGDDVGQTTVYSLRNLNLHMGHGKQLEDLIPSAASRQP